VNHALLVRMRDLLLCQIEGDPITMQEEQRRRYETLMIYTLLEMELNARIKVNLCSIPGCPCADPDPDGD